ncbi:Gfo/Idh/MocA family oxidoreductase [Kribbella sancticallisti]|uniref:Gfo/Idh/MocA family oxidoreductase n=1 Tax=Kribbella sancticallisti TaxID=460087 RepID=A0ABP4MUL2_9ACTN
MLDLLAPIAAQVAIDVPPEHRRGIALVGAGAIVDVAHLPAYRGLGLDIRGLYDVRPEQAKRVAGRHGIGRVYGSLEELLGDESVEVVDVAVVPWAQPDVVRQVIAAGKHVLCQKPFAPDLVTARELIDAATRAGVRLAVNQQLRWDEGIAAARAMVRAGWIGTPTTTSFTVDISTDWSAWDWLVRSDRLEIMYHSIHYLDAVRSILGDPRRVFATASRRSGQLATGETRTISTLVYDGDTRAVLHVNHENTGGDQRAEFRIDGTEGAIRGTLGLLYDYPHGRPDTLEVFSRVAPTDGWLAYPVTRRWIPWAFGGPMAGLLGWIADGTPSPTAAEDNIGTLALVQALYGSIDDGQARTVEAG